MHRTLRARRIAMLLTLLGSGISLSLYIWITIEFSGVVSDLAAVHTIRPNEQRICRFQIQAPAVGRNYWLCVRVPEDARIVGTQFEELLASIRITVASDTVGSQEILGGRVEHICQSEKCVLFYALTATSTHPISIVCELLDDFDWPSEVSLALTLSNFEIKEQNLLRSLIDDYVKPSLLVITCVFLGILAFCAMRREK